MRLSVLLSCAIGLATFSATAQIPPQNQVDLSGQSALSDVKPVLIGVGADGSEAKETLSFGTFELDGAHSSASSYIPIAGLFTGSMITKLSVAGEISESKAPSGLARIELVGYSPKKAGQWGSVILVKPKAESGKRFVKTKDMAMDKDFIKPVADFAKLTQTTEGTWVFQIIKPLPAGHYLITFSKNPPGFWDFDVK